MVKRYVSLRWLSRKEEEVHPQGLEERAVPPSPIHFTRKRRREIKTKSEGTVHGIEPMQGIPDIGRPVSKQRGCLE